MTTAASALTAVVPLDVPVGWSHPYDVNMLHALLLLGGVPLLLMILITVAVYVPSLARGERIAPGQPPVENQWLGGPRTGTAELKGRSPRTPRLEAPVAAGERSDARLSARFSANDRVALDEAIRKAERLSRAEFSVFVGHAEGDPRAYASACTAPSWPRPAAS